MIRAPQDPDLNPTLTGEQLSWLSGHGRERYLRAGEHLFREHDPVDSFYVLLEGEIRILRVGGDGAEEAIATLAPGGFAGQLMALAGKTTRGRARAVVSSRVLEITADDFRRVVAAKPELADVFIATTTRRTRYTQAWMRQTEKLAALGKLSAGLAHELNNPAAAVGRSAGALAEVFESLPELAIGLSRSCRTPAQLELLTELQRRAASEAARSAAAPDSDPLALSDLEDEVALWLEECGVEGAWELAPSLVGAGLDTARLDEVAESFDAGSLGDVLRWLAATLAAAGLLGEIHRGASRISELVGAVKTYSHMDRAALREVDVHEGLESTLVMLGHKLKKGGVTVARDYDPSLPPISARAGELNQVWTNLLDNAVDAATDGGGRVAIRTSRENDRVLVEVADDGPGIPAEVRDRIFEPFFSTKDVGEGTGLGLDIARRIVVGTHKGDIRVRSRPGDTRFQVRLPVNAPEDGRAEP